MKPDKETTIHISRPEPTAVVMYGHASILLHKEDRIDRIGDTGHGWASGMEIL